MTGRESWARRLTFFVSALGLAISLPPPVAQAQHTDYLLGSGGLFVAEQPPPGVYYQNQASYYWSDASNSLKRLNFDTDLNLFLDLNTIGWTTPWKFLGARYGMNVTFPLMYVKGALDARTKFQSAFVQERFGSSTSRDNSEFGITSIYVEPINLMWELPQFHLFLSVGFYAPAGNYDPKKAVNTGLGRWSEQLSLGGTVWFDPAREWSLSAMSRYLIHQSQQDVDFTVGDDLTLEWGLAKTFKTEIGPVNVGIVGYAFWQVTDNKGSTSVSLPPALAARLSPVLAAQQGKHSSVYALGPEVAATTKYGKYFLRYFYEFGSESTTEGQMIVLGGALLF